MKYIFLFLFLYNCMMNAVVIEQEGFDQLTIEYKELKKTDEILESVHVLTPGNGPWTEERKNRLDALLKQVIKHDIIKIIDFNSSQEEDVAIDFKFVVPYFCLRNKKAEVLKEFFLISRYGRGYEYAENDPEGKYRIGGGCNLTHCITRIKFSKSDSGSIWMFPQ